MAEYQVQIQKGRDGWQAKTSVELPDNRVLQLRTGKHSVRGHAAGVAVNASVHTRDGQFLTHELFGDYNETVLTVAGRCTELSVTTAHAEAVRKVPELLEAIKAHYVAKAAKEAKAA